MRFDVHALTRGSTPYVVDVQSEFTSHFETRVVIPIVLEGKVPRRIAELHPLIDLKGDRYVLVTHMMTSVSRRELGRAVESLAGKRDEILRALDVLFTGF